METVSIPPRPVVIVVPLALARGSVLLALIHLVVIVEPKPANQIVPGVLVVAIRRLTVPLVRSVASVVLDIV